MVVVEVIEVCTEVVEIIKVQEVDLLLVVGIEVTEVVIEEIEVKEMEILIIKYMLQDLIKELLKMI